MKAAVLTRTKKFEIRDIPDIKHSDLGSREVLVKIMAAAICGTDLHLYDGSIPVKCPVILGHEASGVVADTAEDSRLKKGQKVIIDPLFSCGKCALCSSGRANICLNRKFLGIDFNGSFSQFVKVPENNLVPFENLSFEEAALTEPASVALHVLRRANIKLGDTVLVIGSGPIGLLIIQLLKISGARVIASEIIKSRLKAAKEFGAEPICPKKGDCTEKVLKLGQEIDAVIEVAGTPETLEQCLKVVRKGGKIIVVGLTSLPAKLDSLTISRKEVEIIGSNAYMMQKEGLFDIINKIKTKPLITHTLALEDIEKGFQLAINKKAIKVILKP